MQSVDGTSLAVSCNELGPSTSTEDGRFEAPDGSIIYNYMIAEFFAQNNFIFRTIEYLRGKFCDQPSVPINAASNNHSPKRCSILLHLGRPGAKGGLISWPSEVIAANHNCIHKEKYFCNNTVKL